jgi:O-acetyl-ADP-ribose deacetylase (regulator of RNase III)
VVRLHLVDINLDMVLAWREAFRPFPEVTVGHGDLLSRAENAVVSPANSFGFMDGGIDRAYAAFFGPQVEERVREAVARRPEGHLPVGAALAVRTGHARIPFLVVAATMVSPEAVSEDHAYRALRAVLRLAGQHPEVGRLLFCPGLATGVGGVAPAAAAMGMAQAYGGWKEAAGSYA